MELPNNDKLKNQMTTLSAIKNYSQLRSTKQPQQTLHPSINLRYRHNNPSDFQQDQLNDSIKKHQRKIGLWPIIIKHIKDCITEEDKIDIDKYNDINDPTLEEIQTQAAYKFIKLELGINSSTINILNTKMTDKQDIMDRMPKPTRNTTNMATCSKT